MTEYSLHPVLERAKLADYLDLFQAAYGANDKLSLAYLQWLYCDNPDGAAVGVDAYLGDELAAHYVTIPRRYVADGQVFTALLSVNTATHPNHQRRGLFKKLANATYDRGAELGFQAVYGVANAQSVHGFTRSLGFEHLGQVRLAIWRNPPEPAASATHLDMTPQWLGWRLSNPSSRYHRLGQSGGATVIGTYKGPVPFALATVADNRLSPANIQLAPRSLLPVPTLAPVFPATGQFPLLPLRLQPSPWHVIMRPLGNVRPAETLRRVTFDGLSMDTF